MKSGRKQMRKRESEKETVWHIEMERKVVSGDLMNDLI